MKLVGGDTGRIEKEEMIDHQIIGTSERYVIELYYDTPGTYPIMHRGQEIGSVTVEPSDANRLVEFEVLRSNASDYADVRNQAATLLAKAPDKNLRLDIEMEGMMGEMMNDMNSGGSGMGMMGENNDDDMMREHCKMMPEMAGCEPYLDEGDEEAEHGEDGIEWEDDMGMMNRMSTDETIRWEIWDTDSEKRNRNIRWSFNQGDLVKVRIFNDDEGTHPMQHPIHFHGQKFVVLAKDGELNENMQWKDSVLIPEGATYDILIEMSNPGTWMAHCHIAEHLDAGMMFNFEVK